MRRLHALISVFLLFLVMSCSTVKSIEPVEIPDIEYPEFPVDVTNPDIKLSLEEDYVVIDNTDDNRQVKIPLWFWLRLVEYSINVDGTIQQYKAVIEKLNR